MVPLDTDHPPAFGQQPDRGRIKQDCDAKAAQFARELEGVSARRRHNLVQPCHREWRLRHRSEEVDADRSEEFHGVRDILRQQFAQFRVIAETGDLMALAKIIGVNLWTVGDAGVALLFGPCSPRVGL